MAIYLVSVEPDGYKELTLPDGVSFAQCDCLRWSGESKINTWATLELVWLNDDLSQDSDVDADFIKFSGAMVVSARAFEGLSQHLGGQVEFLPVVIAGETRYILNVLNVLDIMDKEKSIYKIYSDGKVGACEHAYINEPDEGQVIYKVKGFLGRTFSGDSFVELVNDLGLTGALIRQYKNP